LYCRVTKPQTFADCIGDELPYGWEECIDSDIGVYYIDHINRKSLYSFNKLYVAQQWKMELKYSLKTDLV